MNLKFLVSVSLIIFNVNAAYSGNCKWESSSLNELNGIVVKGNEVKLAVGNYSGSFEQYTYYFKPYHADLGRNSPFEEVRGVNFEMICNLMDCKITARVPHSAKLMVPGDQFNIGGIYCNFNCNKKSSYFCRWQ